MPATFRLSEFHVSYLANVAREDPTLCGELHIKDTDHNTPKWQKRWGVLYQNCLFYFENSSCGKPVGMIFLEHSTIDVLSLTKLRDLSNQHTFYIAIPEDSQQQKYYLRANSEDECNLWVKTLQSCSYAKLQLENKELGAKYYLSTQILETEQAAKEQLLSQCVEYDKRIQSLENELANFNRQVQGKQEESQDDEMESDDIQKIKKVQSLVRAWLCRRRWHSVVQDYIVSGHASNIRQRNQVIFHFVREEEEYVNDLATLVTSFLRPFRMAASAKKPPTSHEEVNSIFLNCEIILFLHQIFLKGLHTRMEDWPTIILGDLFRILLPMYGIYQEYVRNHHYSMQMLAECKKHSPSFNRLLAFHEEKPVCVNRSLETFLTLPMHRVPGYIITLHRILAFTPPDHVDRKSLEHAQCVLEDLSLLMHDEVSETENIRKNLSIERQIVGGCEELLDVRQVFIRQGSLIQVEESHKKPILSFAGLGIKPHERKEYVRHCVLFSGLLLIATKSSNGKLHLHKSTGKLCLANVSVLENIYEEDLIFDVSTPSPKADQQYCWYADMALRVIVHPRDGESPFTITLVAQTAHEKAAWLSDLKQCIENMILIDNVQDTSMPTSRHFTNVRNDPSLYTDDVGIKYSKCLNSCRIPRIRYASLKRLFERLLDLRFLSIEFLNTFLITYRIFTDADTILDVLEKFYHDRQRSFSLPMTSADVDYVSGSRRMNSMNEKYFNKNHAAGNRLLGKNHVRLSNEETIEDDQETAVRPTTLQIPTSCYYRRHSSPSALGEGHVFHFPTSVDSTTSCSPTESEEFFSSNLKRSRNRVNSSPTKPHRDDESSVASQAWSQKSSETNLGSQTWPRLPQYNNEGDSLSCVYYSNNDKGKDARKMLERSELRDAKLRQDLESSVESIPVITMNSLPTEPLSENSETTDNSDIDANNNPSPLPSDSASYRSNNPAPISGGKTTRDGKDEGVGSIKANSGHQRGIKTNVKENHKKDGSMNHQKQLKSSANSVHCGFSLGLERSKELPEKRPNSCPKTVGKHKPDYLHTSSQENPSPKHSKTRSQSLLERRKNGKESKYGLLTSGELKPKRKFSFPRPLSPRLNSSPVKPLASPGAVVTSSRASKRRTSITAAAAAFAAATAGAPCSPSSPLASSHARFSFREVQGPLARVLTILHHWLIKHGEDFHNIPALQLRLKTFIDKVRSCEKTTTEQRRFCNIILQTLERDPRRATDEKLFERFFLQQVQTHELSFDKLSSSQLAEQLTLTEHLLFSRIPAYEFLNLSWMKPDKEMRAPNILKVSQRFNEVSRLVASEILSRSTASSRAAAIEKWVVVADVCRHLCNFNAVLEIVSALMSSSVFRLKKTWEKLSKQTKAMVDKLQDLVSTDGRFKNMREALRCSNPPCIPYLGFYLTDLAFIEEGTSVKNESGLINFSKMRMIAQVVEEIRQYQEIRYNIQHDSRVTDYLFNQKILMDENSLYKTSLTWEPKKRPSVRLKKGDSQD